MQKRYKAILSNLIYLLLFYRHFFLYYEINNRRDLKRTITESDWNLVFIYNTVCSLILK